MTRHAEVARSRALRKVLPVLCNLAAQIGDAQVRNRGTIGGSIANSDPAADYPAAVIGLGATVHTNKRTIAAADYFKDLFETALEPGEIVKSIEFPVPKRAAYCKFPNPASRYAVVGVLVADFGGKYPRRRHRRGSVCIPRHESRRGAERKTRAAIGRRGRDRVRPVQQRPARDRGISRQSRARDGAARGWPALLAG